MTQCERVLNYLETHGTITPMEAMKELGIMRLGARIWDLRHDGHNIHRKMVSGKTRYGDQVAYAEYRLVKEDTDAIQ